jgi:hypothetical protein
MLKYWVINTIINSTEALLEARREVGLEMKEKN